jgi:hypothetical protein
MPNRLFGILWHERLQLGFGALMPQKGLPGACGIDAQILPTNSKHSYPQSGRLSVEDPQSAIRVIEVDALFLPEDDSGFPQSP